MRTIDQDIAQTTHEAASREQYADPDFRNAIKKAATRVRTAGFGVTMAFAIGKKEQHLAVAEAWCAALKQLGEQDCATPEAALATYRTGDFAYIRRLTERSERILEWMAKWADAYKTDR